MKFDIPERVEHGGKIRWFHDAAKRDLIDFSASLNPYPPHITWKPDFSRISAYPDDTYYSLKNQIGHLFHRKPEEICVGNGSVELIRSFCQACITPGATAVINPPTFGEYAFSVQLAGGIPDFHNGTATIRFLCNPNNPTGELTSRQQVLTILEASEEREEILFVDEAFIELADPSESVADVASSNLFVIRSLTKSFSIPGLRFGYGFGEPELIETIETRRLPWTVNACAEEFALHAFQHFDELEKSRKLIARERNWLYSQFDQFELEYLPSAANFILIHLHHSAADVSSALLRHDILVRDCSSFGLPESIRIAVRTRDENIRLIEALALCLR